LICSRGLSRSPDEQATITTNAVDQSLLMLEA
jgi:hypothetical protein